MLILKIVVFVCLLMAAGLIIRYKLYPNWQLFLDDLFGLLTLDFLPGALRPLVGIGLVLWGASWLVTRFTGDLRSTGQVAQIVPESSVQDLASAAATASSEGGALEAGGDSFPPVPPPGAPSSRGEGAPQEGKETAVPVPEPAKSPVAPVRSPTPPARATPAEPETEKPQEASHPSPSPAATSPPVPSPPPETTPAAEATPGQTPALTPAPVLQALPEPSPTPGADDNEAGVFDSTGTVILAGNPPPLSAAGAEGGVEIMSAAHETAAEGKTDAAGADPPGPVYYHVVKQNGKAFVGRLTAERQGKYYFEKPNGDVVALPVSQIREIRPYLTQEE